MKKLVIMLMVVLSVVGFGKTFKEAMNEDLTGNVWITAVIRYKGEWYYTVTDRTYIGLVAMGPNDTPVVMKSTDPTLLPGAGKRKFIGWISAGNFERWMYESAANGQYPEITLLNDYRAQINRSGKKNAQKSRL